MYVILIIALFAVLLIVPFSIIYALNSFKKMLREDSISSDKEADGEK